MKGSRETFFEDFNYFKKNLTSRVLFVKSEGKLGYSKQHDIFYYLFASFLVIGVGLALFELKPIFVITVIGISMVSFLVANLLDVLFIKRTLKAKGLPSAWEFYKWNCDELENDRVKRIIPKYYNHSDEIIEQLITIANNQKQSYEKVPQYGMIKTFEFLAKNFYVVSIGLMIFYYQQKTFTDVLAELYQYLLMFMVISFTLSGFWDLLVKKSIFENRTKKVKLLQDYIFVLSNILLVRKNKFETLVKSDIESNLEAV
ncbi:hypothetical protein [uncultured Aquimarina sp.]|uniref:hypothetical protein n=1 Tax=uncultured Aquimarina sp. TaxID=575652 RepID=UPI002619DF45|nr:hypothetical protein [uncultured Aquimarina sp.]